MATQFNPPYTAGSWLTGNAADKWINVFAIAGSEPTAERYLRQQIIAQVNNTAPGEEALANLRLIQSAPKLFEALKGMLAWNGTLFAPPPVSWSPGGIGVNRKARAALAEAAGICLE